MGRPEMVVNRTSRSGAFWRAGSSTFTLPPLLARDRRRTLHTCLHYSGSRLATRD